MQDIADEVQSRDLPGNRGTVDDKRGNDDVRNLALFVSSEVDWWN